MKHHCHAIDCTNVVPPKLLMCAKHWAMVSKETQKLVCLHFTHSRGERPSANWMKAARRAIAEVRHKENPMGILRSEP